jgi:hypothetical protein
MQVKQNEAIANMNVILINYANNSFKKSQKKNSKTGKKIGCFDKVISYREKDIDRDFREINKEILNQKRGGGYWLWKPYFIKKTLDDLKYGDFLFYCDSGSYFINSIEELVQLCLNKNQDVIPFELTHYEKDWTKRDAFVLMDCENEIYYVTKQRLGGFVLIRKSEISMNFVSEWLYYSQDKNIITDIENQCGLENFPEFKEHRHDQSIFSLLTKKYKFLAYRDPSQFGSALKEFYPDSKYEEFIKLTRKRDISIYFMFKKWLKKNKTILYILSQFKGNKLKL